MTPKEFIEAFYEGFYTDPSRRTAWEDLEQSGKLKWTRVLESVLRHLHQEGLRDPDSD